MSFSSGSRERNTGVSFVPVEAEQLFREVQGEKRRVAGGGHDEARIRRGFGRPAQSGQHASERTGEVRASRPR